MRRSVAVQPHFSGAFAAPKPGASPFSFGGKKPFQFTARPQPSQAKILTVASATAAAAFTPGDALLRKWKALASDQMYVLPPYYPRCERRSATSSQDVEDLLDRLYATFKKLSIQARHETSFATFGLVLRTGDQSELSLLIWYANKKRTKLYVEVDKRQSSGKTFPFQYIMRILKAIKAGPDDMESNDSVSLPQHKELRVERCNKMNLVVGSCAPQSPPQEPEPYAAPAVASSPLPSFACVGDQTLSSLEMCWGLMKRPVTWSHGLELLGTVTDPDKSGTEAAKVASKAILLGVAPLSHGDTCCSGIHKKLVGLMQSLVGDEAVGEVSTEHLSTYQKDCLLQLVLTCLVNAMEVHVKFVAEGGMDISMALPEGASVMSQFLESTKDVVACDIIETLMDIMRRANTKPHHAYLAVKALFLLSSENSAMRQCVSMAMSKEDDAQTKKNVVLQEAHEIGAQSHGLLEAECERLSRLLSRH